MFFIVWILSLCILLAFLMYPIFQNRAMKAAADRFGNQLRQNPALGEAFAQTLYKPVGWMDADAGWDTKTLTTRFSRLPARVGNFLIHYSQRVSEDSYLVVTTVKQYHGETVPRQIGHTERSRNLGDLQFEFCSPA